VGVSLGVAVDGGVGVAVAVAVGVNVAVLRCLLWAMKSNPNSKPTPNQFPGIKESDFVW